MVCGYPNESSAPGQSYRVAPAKAKGLSKNRTGETALSILSAAAQQVLTSYFSSKREHLVPQLQ